MSQVYMRVGLNSCSGHVCSDPYSDLSQNMWTLVIAVYRQARYIIHDKGRYKLVLRSFCARPRVPKVVSVGTTRLSGAVLLKEISCILYQNHAPLGLLSKGFNRNFTYVSGPGNVHSNNDFKGCS